MPPAGGADKPRPERRAAFAVKIDALKPGAYSVEEAQAAPEPTKAGLQVPNIGLPEIAIVMVIALIVFGPKRLPEMGRQLGKTIREFRDATSDIRSQIGIDDIADSVKDIKSGLSLTSSDGAPNAAAVATPAAIGTPDATASTRRRSTPERPPAARSANRPVASGAPRSRSCRAQRPGRRGRAGTRPVTVTAPVARRRPVTRRRRRRHRRRGRRRGVRQAHAPLRLVAGPPDRRLTAAWSTSKRKSLSSSTSTNCAGASSTRPWRW